MKKIAKIRKKEQVNWFQHSLVIACWFLPLDAAQVSESGVSQCLCCPLLALRSLFEATSDHSLWLILWGLAAPRMDQDALQSCLL